MTQPIIYPASLPVPQQAGVQSVERRVLSPPAGTFESRAGQRDRLAVQDVTFPPFDGDQAIEFDEWWRVTLRRGGLWFAAEWPLPQGWVQAVRRFLEPPAWDYIPGGFWSVTARFEVRGTGLLPQTEEEELIYTSWPYALVARDSANLGLSIPLGGVMLPVQQDFANLGLSVPLSGDLATILQTYSQPPEAANLGLSIPTAGDVVVVLRSYTQPAEQTANLGLSIPLSGDLVVRLVTYDQPAESANLGLSIPLSGTLT